MLAVAAGLFVFSWFAAWPVIGWWIDRVVWPGDNPNDIAWLVVPYTIYGGIIGILGAVALGMMIHHARLALRVHGPMESIFDPIPPNKNIKALLEAEEIEPQPAARPISIIDILQ
jgi:quinol-cytochrome oxidoreductase complex cytochrome b subunit